MRWYLSVSSTWYIIMKIQTISVMILHNESISVMILQNEKFQQQKSRRCTGELPYVEFHYLQINLKNRC